MDASGVGVSITSIDTQWGHECNVACFEVCCQFSTLLHTSVHVDMDHDITFLPIALSEKLVADCQLSIALQCHLNEF